MKQKLIVQPAPLIALLVLCIAIFSLANSLSDTIHRKSMLKARQEALLNLQVENQKIEKKLQLVQSPESIEKEARNKLNLAKPGETVILISNPPTDLADDQEQTIQQLSNWKKWWNLFY
jgi:cell division protein FtsB